MGQPRIPNALEMRALKYGGRPDAQKDRTAELLREAGRRTEALLLFDGRPDHPFLEEERRWAIESGRAFHLLGLKRLGHPVGPRDYEACARAAESSARWLDARSAWLAAGDAEALRRFAEHLPESLRPEPAASDAEETAQEAGPQS